MVDKQSTYQGTCERDVVGVFQTNSRVDKATADDGDGIRDGAEVIVTGEYRNGIFVADELQTKCASRYEGDLREESNYKLEELEI